MKIIYNKVLPVKGFSAINLFGVVFAREGAKPLSGTTLNHERIHTAQITELLFIFFYSWYIIEWAVRLMKYRDRKVAYKNISFEREAFANQQDSSYLKNRKSWAFTRYL